jgi:hypothetical protein
MTTGNDHDGPNPNAPGVDEMTRRRREALEKLQRLSIGEVFQLAVRAGIYTIDGELTEPYGATAAPSSSRPTD